MAYSFTEKKRIRKDFGKLGESMELPYLLAIQTESYRQFLQADIAPEAREDTGLNAAFKSIFPIVSYSGNAALEYVDYKLGKPVFDEEELIDTCLIVLCVRANPEKDILKDSSLVLRSDIN